jgi:hypothetical protein
LMVTLAALVVTVPALRTITGSVTTNLAMMLLTSR